MGKRSWLDQLLQEKYLPAIALLPNSEQGRVEAVRLCQELRQVWTDRGFVTADQQSSLMYQTRQAIQQQWGKGHFSLQLIKLERNEHFEVNQKRQMNARNRQQHQQFLTKPDEIVRRAVDLLESNEWAEVAAGLAVLTGRRLNEVLKTAQFSVKSQWVVTFEGALKRRDDPVVFDIPTLARAERVVQATDRLRQITPDGASEIKVGLVSDRSFSDLVPLPHGKENLYSHLWRSVYCCIATFWYCPKHVDDLLFKAHIMGHFESLPPDEQGDERQLRQRLETFGSDRHYRLYEIDDDIIAQFNGKRKGIKLGHMGIHPLEVFEGGMPQYQPEPVQRKHRSSLRVWREDHPMILDILNHFPGKNQVERANAWIQWSFDQLHLNGATAQQFKQGQEQDVGAIAQQQILGAGSESDENGAIALEQKLGAGRETEENGAIAPHQPGNSRLVQSNVSLTPEDTGDASLVTEIRELVSVMRLFVEAQGQNAAPTQKAQPKIHRQTKRGDRSPSQSEYRSPEKGQEQEQEQGQGQSARVGRRRGDDDLIIDQAISAIIAYNDQEGRLHDDKWLITVSLLKKFTEKGNQRAAQRGLDARANEVQQHHNKHHLQNDHNNRHKKHDVTTIVQP